MPESDRSFGIPGVPLHSGDHLCSLHSGSAERDKVLVPYLQEGIRAGDKCLVVFDAGTPSKLIDALGGGAEVAASLESGQLDIRTFNDVPVIPTGSLTPESLFMFWEGEMRPAFESGAYTFGRLGGEAGWWLHHLPSSEELIQYESFLNRYMSLRPQSVLCMYDLETFGDGIIVDMVMTHPMIVVHDLVVANPYFLAPDEFLSIRGTPDAASRGDEIRDWFAQVSAA
jgi:hypothetical protein